MSAADSILGRLRKLASGKPQVPADIEAAIAEVGTLLAEARQEARATRERHSNSLIALIAADDVKGLTRGRQELRKADERVATLTGSLAALEETLAQSLRENAARTLDERWKSARALLDRRAAAMADLQDSADDFARKLAHTVAITDEVWCALPELPNFRPASYGRDLNARLNTYLFGITDGRVGSGAISAYAARQKPDLKKLDADARTVLLMPANSRK